MSESKLWTQRVQPAFKKIDEDGFYMRIENKQSSGTSDVHYSFKIVTDYFSGWIELKYVKEWPKRESTTLKIRHFTTQQRFFLIDYGRSGGHAGMLLQVADEYFWINWDKLHHIGMFTKSDFRKHFQTWNKKDFETNLRGILT